jgi:hypothetical protein
MEELAVVPVMGFLSLQLMYLLVSESIGSFCSRIEGSDDVAIMDFSAQ